MKLYFDLFVSLVLGCSLVFVSEKKWNEITKKVPLFPKSIKIVRILGFVILFGAIASIILQGVF